MLVNNDTAPVTEGLNLDIPIALGILLLLLLSLAISVYPKNAAPAKGVAGCDILDRLEK